MEALQGTSAWYPTRLLDLGDPLKVNIIETANKKLDGSYATLSHCWGDGNHLRLTKDNRTALLIEIPELAKTFAEAISVCRKLGLRYLWIDSFCIVQDDVDDWIREAALMDYVYRRAWCNIAAAASHNSSEGLFRERIADDVGEILVDLERIGKVGISDERLLVGEVDNCPLQGRAWVLQERLLSRRILHFGEGQIFWECTQLTACERFPDGLPQGVKNDGIRNVFGSETSTSANEAATSWSAIVEDYTRRAMTCSSDKLPALSGVAKTLRAVMGGTYLAGVWDNGNLLHHHLAWSTTGPQLRPRPAYRAPTWSWASIDHPVKFWHKPGTDCLFHTKLVQAYVDPTGTDDTGAVKGGFLLLQGHLKRISQPYNKEALSEAIKLHLDTCEEIDYGDLFFLSLFTEYFMEETRYGDID